MIAFTVDVLQRGVRFYEWLVGVAVKVKVDV